MNAIDIDEAKFVQFCSNLTMVCVVDLTSLVCFVFAFVGGSGTGTGTGTGMLCAITTKRALDMSGTKIPTAT